MQNQTGTYWYLHWNQPGQRNQREEGSAPREGFLLPNAAGCAANLCMKAKTSTFDAENLRIAQVILQNLPRFGPASLLGQWAQLVVRKARTDPAPEPGGQAELFEAEAK